MRSRCSPGFRRVVQERATRVQMRAPRSRPKRSQWSRGSAPWCSTTDHGIAVAATLSTLQAICCTRVADKSVLAINHDRALLRVGPSRKVFTFCIESVQKWESDTTFREQVDRIRGRSPIHINEMASQHGNQPARLFFSAIPASALIHLFLLQPGKGPVAPRPLRGGLAYNVFNCLIAESDVPGKSN